MRIAAWLSLPAVLGLVAVLAPAVARAQGVSCGGSANSTQDVVEVTPGDGANEVALDAPVLARYLVEVDFDELEAQLAEGAPPAAPAPGLIQLFERVPADRDGERDVLEPVAGRIDRLDAGTIAFVPRGLLARETDYVALIARPGFDHAAPVEFEFTTGKHVDEEAPAFDVGASEVRLASDPLSSDCEGEPGSYVISLDFPPASDDADEGALEYLVFLTRAASLEAPELRARARNFEGSINMSFVLGPEEVREPVCISIRVVDGVGRTAERQREICFDPIQGNYFQPMCTVGPAHGRRGGPGFLIFSALGCVAFGLVARRPRR